MIKVYMGKRWDSSVKNKNSYLVLEGDEKIKIELNYDESISPFLGGTMTPVQMTKLSLWLKEQLDCE